MKIDDIAGRQVFHQVVTILTAIVTEDFEPGGPRSAIPRKVAGDSFTAEAAANSTGPIHRRVKGGHMLVIAATIGHINRRIMAQSPETDMETIGGPTCATSDILCADMHNFHMRPTTHLFLAARTTLSVSPTK